MQKKKVANGANPYAHYEREAARSLARLLPYASRTLELRKKAGFPKRAEGPAFSVDVTFVDRRKMSRLNHRFRGKSQATDVLSFPALEIFARQGHLGDLVICAPILEAQAKEIGHSPSNELRTLLVHGLLHLLGYDHERSIRDSTEMSKWETKILGECGLIKRSAG